ncbi:hypothetical protein RI129_012517 [Pyrocoelia pectoralis]|uniref:Enoyl reductase (ER) domain-containing protein n=1 Tax=Pyrocoelia pectoralis TaxID=417401 RepID=A0AAN7ZC64_9COLE
MEAIQFHLGEKKLELVTKPIPEIKDPYEILVKVAYSGICGTDVHIIEGHLPCNSNVFTLGHEFSGVVVDVGSEVHQFIKGDHVAVDPNNSCGRCHSCHSGDPHYCKIGAITNAIGIYKDGGWAEYVLVPEKQVHKLTEGITLEHAALTEPISCLSHGWDLISPITMGDKILVIGAGIIGNLWVALLHLQGHRRVTVSDSNLSRRELLQKLSTGFECIAPAELRQRQEKDPNYLFDVIIDCTGSAPAMEHAFSLLNTGGTLCIFGVAPQHAKISISPFDINKKEIRIVGVNINPFSFPKSLGFLESLSDRYLQFEKLGVKTFPLKDYKEALEALKKRAIAKAVFKL